MAYCKLNSLFDYHNPVGIKYFTRIRFSRLQEDKFKHDFKDISSAICYLNLPFISHSTVL